MRGETQRLCDLYISIGNDGLGGFFSFKIFLLIFEGNAFFPEEI